MASPDESGLRVRGPGTYFDRLVVALNALGSVWVFCIMILVVADVAARYLLNRPITGVPLVITMSLIAIAFLQLPDALRNGRVTRNEALLIPLLESKPRAGLAVEALFNLMGVFLMALLAVYVAPMFQKAWETESFLGSRGDFTLPEWPFKFLIVLGAVVTGLQYLVMCWRDLRKLLALVR